MRLMAYFEASGCKGVVLAGTNGEGPSLSAYEKRELLRSAQACRGNLKLILAIATSSLDEAVWLTKQAAKDGADALLLMPPSYFKNASENGIERWFLKVLESSELPVLIYNFPKMTGITLTPEFIARFKDHPKVAGCKDSSGDASNLASYRAAFAENQQLFVGDETILLEALRHGWTGTISGAANLVPAQLVRIVAQWFAKEGQSATTAYELLLPVLKAIRSNTQPSANKAVLCSLGVLTDPRPRLPLEAVDVNSLLDTLRDNLGIQTDKLGI